MSAAAVRRGRPGEGRFGRARGGGLHEAVEVPRLGPARRGRLLDDDGTRSCVGEDVPGFALLVEHVDRHRDHAGLEAREDDRDVFRPVGQVERQPIARCEPASGELVGDAGAPRVELAEAEHVGVPFQAGF